jgi:hypothetical protein
MHLLTPKVPDPGQVYARQAARTAIPGITPQMPVAAMPTVVDRDHRYPVPPAPSTPACAPVTRRRRALWPAYPFARLRARSSSLDTPDPALRPGRVSPAVFPLAGPLSSPASAAARAASRRSGIEFHDRGRAGPPDQPRPVACGRGRCRRGHRADAARAAGGGADRQAGHYRPGCRRRRVLPDW